MAPPVHIISAARGRRRPVGVLRSVVRYRALLLNLVLADLRIKYRDAFLGVVWSLLQPLATILVYDFAFNTVFRVGIPNFTVFLLAGLLPWNFFAASAASGTTAMVDRMILIHKIGFPSEVLPIARVLFHLVQFLLTFLVFVPVALVMFGVRPGPEALLFIPLLALHALFTIGVALTLSLLTTVWRDVAHLTETVLPLLFLLTQIIYPVEVAPSFLQTFSRLTPIAAFAIAHQDVLDRGQAPAAATVGILVLWTAIALVVGFALLGRLDPRLGEQVR